MRRVYILNKSVLCNYYTTINSPVRKESEFTDKRNSNLNSSNMDPWYITGFTATPYITTKEGSFMISFSKTSESRYGYRIRPIFQKRS